MAFRPPVSTPAIPLSEFTGAPRSNEAKLAQIVEAAVTAANEKTNSALVTELKNVVRRLEQVSNAFRLHSRHTLAVTKTSPLRPS
jgi:hypothetical protein